jgi:hypothetical protein
MEDIMNIEQEQAIAKEVMEKIAPFCTCVACAGGAPRDWYDGNTCNDIDIYFVTPFTTLSKLKTMFDTFFPEYELKGACISGEHISKESSEMYSPMEYLQRIFTNTYKGKKVQLIQMTQRCDLLSEMDSCNCQIEWTPSGHYYMTDDFRLGYLTNTLFPTKDGSIQLAHFRKMVERFPDKQVVTTKDQALQQLLRNLMKRDAG